MEKAVIRRIVAEQRAYFEGGHTRSLGARRRALVKLQRGVEKYEKRILAALKADLGKSPMEGYMCEVGMVLSEIRYILKHLDGWAETKRVPTPLAQFPSKSYVRPCPKGNVLVMSPWNYPFLLSVDPVAEALAAGNTVVLKPSAYSPATSAVVADMLAELFPPCLVAVVTGGRAENACLLEEKFDHIFFTGSKAVGREVMTKAARYLTPVTLELGGKSPCIIDKTANIPLAAKRVVFGKFLNCGQTCVAPDYILCDRSVKAAFLECLKKEIALQFGKEPLQNPDYGRMINQKHFDRVSGLIDPEKVIYGGERDEKTLQIAPTVMDGVRLEDPVMQEEIFGPVLPVLTFEGLPAAMELIGRGEKPLALYLFSENKRNIDRVTASVAFGGGCINDVVIHLSTPYMGFGGVGESGMGAYHGKVGFDTFTHYKSILQKSTRIDLPMRYQPYGEKKEKTVRRFLK